MNKTIIRFCFFFSDQEYNNVITNLNSFKITPENNFHIFHNKYNIYESTMGKRRHSFDRELLNKLNKFNMLNSKSTSQKKNLIYEPNSYCKKKKHPCYRPVITFNENHHLFLSDNIFWCK
jgi:hypothetical protein